MGCNSSQDAHQAPNVKGDAAANDSAAAPAADAQPQAEGPADAAPPAPIPVLQGPISSHDRAAAVYAILSYWFGPAYAIDGPVDNFELWYGGAAEVDEHIRKVFLPLMQEAEEGKLAAWVDVDAHSCLALVILLDQFALNAYRDLGRGYDVSALAIPYAYAAVQHGYEKTLPKSMASFLYMPLMHSEKLEDQERCVELFRAQDGEDSSFAIEHRDIVKKYNRFPGRNKAHGRENTDEEDEYLKNGGVF